MPVFDLRPQYGDAIELVSDYAATDDCTPLSINDTQASTGDLTVTFDQRGRPATWKTLKGQSLDVQVTERDARSLGVVQHVSGGDGTVSLAIDTVLNRLAVPRHAAPKVASLGAIMRYWAGLCGVDAADVLVDPAISDAPLAVVGFYEQVWLQMKQLAAAIGFEVIGRDNKIVVRPPRPVTITIDDDLLVSTQWDVDDSSLVRTLEVVYSEPTDIAPGDMTADYSRSTLPPRDADDPFDYGSTAARPVNTEPAGWVGYRRVNT